MEPLAVILTAFAARASAARSLAHWSALVVIGLIPTLMSGTIAVSSYGSCRS
jgi:hypothetical protein